MPKDQDEKLALIDDASFFFENTLTPGQVDPAPTPAQTLEAINKTAADLSGAAKGLDSPAAMQARRLASALDALAKAPPAARDEAERVLVTPLLTTLREVRDLLTAEHVTIDTLPPLLKSAWVAADGEVRIEVAPSGDSNDNAVLRRFVDAVRTVAPQASGAPIFIVEAAATIVKAFLEAAVWSVASIALILFVTLRRWVDVALTLVPLMVAIVVTLEVCVAIGLQLNFANIIALPLLLGVGVAFKIYYVMAWRAGETNFLQSSLTRAVFFSACATATAFGSLWFSHHPGTSSMGKLMALVAGDDALRRRAVPASPPGDPAEDPFGLTRPRPLAKKMNRVWQKGDSRRAIGSVNVCSRWVWICHEFGTGRSPRVRLRAGARELMGRAGIYGESSNACVAAKVGLHGWPRRRWRDSSAPAPAFRATPRCRSTTPTNNSIAAFSG